MLNIKLVLETCRRHYLHVPSWSICWMKEATSWFTCIWCKLPPWIRGRLFCFLWNHPKSVMHTCEVFCSLEACNLHSICVPSTLSHWLTCSRKRSLCLGSNPWTCVKTSISSMMVLHLNSVVFYYKTTTWSCLYGTACSHVVAEPAHVLELTIVVIPRESRNVISSICVANFHFSS